MGGLPPPQDRLDSVDSRWRIGIVRSVWHADCTSRLRDDARDALREAGIDEGSILCVDAPGSFEIPLLAQAMIERKKVDGVIAFGVIVEGATHHARLIAEAATRGLMDVQLKTGIPVINEILHVRSLEDAQARSVGKDAKGGLAARTLLSALARKGELHS